MKSMLVINVLLAAAWLTSSDTELSHKQSPSTAHQHLNTLKLLPGWQKGHPAWIILLQQSTEISIGRTAWPVVVLETWNDKTKPECSTSCYCCVTFYPVLVGRDEGHPTCKKIQLHQPPKVFIWRPTVGPSLIWSNLWNIGWLNTKQKSLRYLKDKDINTQTCDIYTTVMLLLLLLLLLLLMLLLLLLLLQL